MTICVSILVTPRYFDEECHITKSWWCICGLERHSITWDRVPLQTRHFPLNSSLSELHRHVSTRNLITAILSAQFPLSLNDDGRTAFGRVMLVGGEHVWDVDGNMVSRDSSSQTKKSNEKEYHYVWRETKHTREKPTARLSPQLPRRRESKRHLFVVDSLDKHMQNEKELIRLRRFMPAARTTRARSAQFRLRRELPCTRVVQILPAAQTTRTRH